MTSSRDNQKEIQSHLWGDMTMSELIEQQQLVMDRISALVSIMTGSNANPSMIGLLRALEYANDTLTTLINTKTK